MRRFSTGAYLPFNAEVSVQPQGDGGAGRLPATCAANGELDEKKAVEVKDPQNIGLFFIRLQMQKRLVEQEELIGQEIVKQDVYRSYVQLLEK
jgi:hypothetical protein